MYMCFQSCNNFWLLPSNLASNKENWFVANSITITAGFSYSFLGEYTCTMHMLVCLHQMSCEYLPGSKSHQVYWDLFPRNDIQTITLMHCWKLWSLIWSMLSLELNQSLSHCRGIMTSADSWPILCLSTIYIYTNILNSQGQLFSNTPLESNLVKMKKILPPARGQYWKVPMVPILLLF